MVYKGAEQNNVHAQSMIGTMYYCGRGVSKDYKQAIKWYKMAAEQGDAMAQYQVGFFYQQGIGVKQDMYEAIKWFSIASSNGSEDAAEALRELSL